MCDFVVSPELSEVFKLAITIVTRDEIVRTIVQLQLPILELPAAVLGLVVQPDQLQVLSQTQTDATYEHDGAPLGELAGQRLVHRLHVQISIADFNIHLTK